MLPIEHTKTMLMPIISKMQLTILLLREKHSDISKSRTKTKSSARRVIGR